ncbi:CLUMA_CG013924, isoform A [Clunio marinus]|uniref:CLUMA_CG013924, isoform A n=1 Tax=Clunio marinus TaxID=568069 RepID=A0A1J1IKG1_9DIPT|nr:CLUMA_CG013924, isoform A [Clunio marinus]
MLNLYDDVATNGFLFVCERAQHFPFVFPQKTAVKEEEREKERQREARDESGLENRQPGKKQLQLRIRNGERNEKNVLHNLGTVKTTPNALQLIRMKGTNFVREKLKLAPRNQTEKTTRKTVFHIETVRDINFPFVFHHPPTQNVPSYKKLRALKLSAITAVKTQHFLRQNVTFPSCVFIFCFLLFLTHPHRESESTKTEITKTFARKTAFNAYSALRHRERKVSACCPFPT